MPESEAMNGFDNSSLGIETDLLLGRTASKTPREYTRKPFYRPRPLWLVPFAITAAVVRGMTVAPRIEVYTHLTCNRLLSRHQRLYTHMPDPMPGVSSRAVNEFSHQFDETSYVNLTLPIVNSQTEEDPRRLPSVRCISNPAVQASTARLQTIMTMIMGSLSALTTGWWGRFSERHGRTKVLAVSTFGLFMTDLIFILASTPLSPLSSHGHKVILLAPVIEGLLGGWSTLQSITSAYLSDCTSSGSRTSIFSRFSGVFYVGLSAGPSLGGYLINHPVWTRPETDGVLTVTSVFWIAILCSFVNFILVLFVFPESLDKVHKIRATEQQRPRGEVQANVLHETDSRMTEGVANQAPWSGGVFSKLLRPVHVFRPTSLDGDLGKRRDWDLTILGMVVFGCMLAQGVTQMKYLYAGHIYKWQAEQLSYYISFLSTTRAIFLLFILPWIISTFKPRVQVVHRTSQSNKRQSSASSLFKELVFDVRLTRLSLFLEFFSHALVMMAPLPSYTTHGHRSKQGSQTFFVASTSLSSLGSGTIPAAQSLALCILQLRALNGGTNNHSNQQKKIKGVGEVFGALAVLQAVAQSILGPMLFGLVYSETVAKFPRAIFMMAAIILLSSLTLTMFVGGAQARVTRSKKSVKDVERGRSRVSKDLRGTTTNYGSIPNAPSTSQHL